MMNADITTKSAYKLLQQLESDPQLQSIEDTSILKDEPSIINLKDNIPFDRFPDRFPVKAIMIIIITMYICSLCGQITIIYCVN